MRTKEEDKNPDVAVQPLNGSSQSDLEWNTGILYGESQNFSREVSCLPVNNMETEYTVG